MLQKRFSIRRINHTKYCKVYTDLARTAQEKIVDKFLSAYIANECHHTFDISHLSETKFQKLVFLSERKLVSKNVKALNYPYIKYKNGPFSFQVRTDFNLFKAIESVYDQYLTDTNIINMIMDDFGYILKKNDVIISEIDKILNRYALLSLEELLKRVYGLKYRGGRSFTSLKLRTPLLWSLEAENTRSCFDITQEELRDLSFCFSPKVAALLNPALDEMRRGKKPFEEISRAV